MTTTRTLILMRHAKSGYPDGVHDHERPLAPRGEIEGALAGDWLRAHLPGIDEVLVSSAVRTRATVAATGVTAPVRVSPQIYEAAPDDILEQVRQTVGAVSTLLVVGHSPGMPGLAMELAGRTSLDQPLQQLRSRFPTAAIAVLEVDGDWVDLAPLACRLVAFHIPRR